MGAKSDDSEQLFNRNLTALIAVIFLFYGGLSCLYSTLVPHLIELGFRSIEISYLLTIVALISIIGPLIFAPLIDLIADRRKAQFGCFLQFILALLLVLGAIAYGMLLLVPTVRRTPSKELTVTFGCDASGAVIFQRRCAEEKTCYHWDGAKLGSLTLENCSYTCQTPEKFESLYHEWLDAPRPIASLAQSIIDDSFPESSKLKSKYDLEEDSPDYDSKYEILNYLVSSHSLRSPSFFSIRFSLKKTLNDFFLLERQNHYYHCHSEDVVLRNLILMNLINHHKLFLHTFVSKIKRT